MIKVLHVVDKFGVKGSSVHGVSRLFSWWIPKFDKDQFDVRLICEAVLNSILNEPLFPDYFDRNSSSLRMVTW